MPERALASVMKVWVPTGTEPVPQNPGTPGSCLIDELAGTQALGPCLVCMAVSSAFTLAALPDPFHRDMATP